MKRRELLGAGLAGAVISGCRGVRTDTAGLLVPEREGPPPTRVVIIGWDGVYTPALRDGSLDLPNVARLRALGTRCTHAWASYPLCAPARGAWLSGLPNLSNAQIGNNYQLNEAVPSLIQAFSDAGFACELYGKQHSNNDEDGGILWGYQRWLHRKHPDFRGLAKGYQVDGEESWKDLEDQALFDEIEALTGVPFGGQIRPQSQDPDHVLQREAMTAITRLEATGQPWLVNLSQLGPHHPYSMPEAFWYALDREALAQEPWDREGYLDSAMARRLIRQRGWAELEPQHRGLVRARQFGYLLYMDHLLGELLDFLEAQGLLNETLILFQSDHGVMAGDKGLFLKTDFFAAACRISAIVSCPGLVPAGVDYAGPLSSMDLLPTLLSLCDVPVPKGTVGQPAGDALRAQAPQLGPQQALSYLSFNTEGQPQGRMIQKGVFKACFYNGSAFPNGGPDVQLYNLEQDPDEEVNLSEDPAYEDTLARLLEALEREEAGYPDYLVAPYRMPAKE